MNATKSNFEPGCAANNYKTKFCIRFFDLIFSAVGLLFFLPLIVLIAIQIKSSSKGPVFFLQRRIGRFGKAFTLVKFRTMAVRSETSGFLTIGGDDPRITKAGRWLRKHKLDELPQLWNILAGEMSFVGPRPEVGKFVDIYTHDQRGVLNVKPGLTDYASLEFYDESDLLKEIEKTGDPESYYINNIIPRKIRLNKYFIDNYSLSEYFKIIFLTQLSISNFRSFLIRNKLNPKWGIFIIDLAITLASMAFAYYLTSPLMEVRLFTDLMEYTFFATIISLLIFKPHNGIIVFSWMHETLKIFSTVALVAAIMIFVFVFPDLKIFSDRFSPSTFVVFFFVSVVMLSKYRQLIKFLFGLSVQEKAFSHAVICGAGMNSYLFIGLIENVVNKGFKVVAIIDPEKKLVGKRINDLKIYHPDDLDKLIIQQKVEKVFFASESDDDSLAALKEKCSFRNIAVSFINASSFTLSATSAN